MSECKVNIGMHVAVSGKIRLQVLREGKVRKDTGWFPNLITNLGLDMLGASQATYGQVDYTAVSRCTVGTGNTAPAVTDTALVSPLAYTSNTIGLAGNTNPHYTSSYVVGPPDYVQAVGTHTFSIGQVVGNIAEIGFGGLVSGSSTQLSLFSRALIMVGGSPGTISVTAADQLIVTYAVCYYLNLTDTPYSVVISGTTYSGTVRVASSQSTLGFLVCPVDRSASVASAQITVNSYNGAIGGVTGTPSGTSLSLTAAQTAAYVLGNYSNTYTASYTTAQSNFTGGVTAFMISCNIGNWQFSVSPALAKDNTKVMTITFSISWSRYP